MSIWNDKYIFCGMTADGKWVEGDLINIYEGCIIHHERDDVCNLVENTKYALAFYPNEISPVYEESVGMYTGVIDKNNKKIFTNDIVISDWGYGSEEPTIVEIDEILYAQTENTISENIEVVGKNFRIKK